MKAKLSDLNDLIQEVNDALSDCIDPIPLREAPHRLQKADLRTIQDAIKSVCPDAVFSPLDITPLRAKQSQYDEIRAALEDCECCCQGSDGYETDDVIASGSVIPVPDDYVMIGGDQNALSLGVLNAAFFPPACLPGGARVVDLVSPPGGLEPFHVCTISVEVYRADTDTWVGSSLDAVYVCGDVDTFPPDDAYIPIQVIAYGGTEETFPLWRVRLSRFGAPDDCDDCTDNPKELCDD